MKPRCVHLSQSLVSLLPATISASVHLRLLPLPCSQSCSMSSSSLHLQVSPHHVVTCVRLVFSFCYTYPCVNFTDTAPSPESSLYFHFTVCLLCFDDHVMITCYLHLHKAQTKPSQRK